MMRKIVEKLPVFLLLIFWLVPLELKSENINEKPWLAFGDLRGYLEPCGCDPRTDMGGVRRIAALVERERINKPDLWLFDLGNLLPSASEEQDIKIPYLLSAIARIRPTASLFNYGEMAGFEAIKEFFHQNPKESLPFVISNGIFSDKLKPLLHNKIEVQDAVILGYVYDENLKQMRLPYNQALKEKWNELLKGSKGKSKILLYAGDQPTLEKILADHLFDLVISSNSSPLLAKVDDSEKKSPGSLLRLSAQDEVYMVPLGGQGVLRGGILRSESARSLAEIMNEKTRTTAPPNSPTMENGFKSEVKSNLNFVTWLDPSYQEAAPLEELMKRYNKKASESFTKETKSRKKYLANSPYAGSEACKSCHASSHEAWLKSKHKSAYITLEIKKKAEDKECVNCHVVGFSEQGGFVSKADSPWLAGVGCENCHGPRKAHIENPKKKSPTDLVAKDACIGCHHGTHSPAFSFEAYWELIKHK